MNTKAKMMEKNVYTSVILDNRNLGTSTYQINQANSRPVTQEATESQTCMWLYNQRHHLDLVRFGSYRFVFVLRHMVISRRCEDALRAIRGKVCWKENHSRLRICTERVEIFSLFSLFSLHYILVEWVYDQLEVCDPTTESIHSSSFQK